MKHIKVIKHHKNSFTSIDTFSKTGKGKFNVQQKEHRAFRFLN